MEMQTVRAMALEKIGRIDEAEAARQLASVEPARYPRTTVYEEFHGRLKQLRIEKAEKRD